MRISSDKERKVVENELRAIGILCDGRNEQIIRVFNTETYFVGKDEYAIIDMDLGDWNLDQYIRGMWTFGQLHSSQSLRESQLWNIAKQISRGLTYIHSKNQVHRDLKPANGN